MHQFFQRNHSLHRPASESLIPTLDGKREFKGRICFQAVPECFDPGIPTAFDHLVEIGPPCNPDKDGVRKGWLIAHEVGVVSDKLLELFVAVGHHVATKLPKGIFGPVVHPFCFQRRPKRDEGRREARVDEGHELMHPVDGQLQKLDEHHYMVRMTPRRAGSLWSARNKEAAERLMAEGRMRPAGLSQIEAAKGDGRWQNAYVSQRYAEPPEDLLNALSLNAAASRFYQTLDRANRYAIIFRVSAAKKLETRTKLITRFVEMLARRETVHGQTGVSRAAGDGAHGEDIDGDK